MRFTLNTATAIVAPEELKKPIENIILILLRDIEKVASYSLARNETKNSNEINLSYLDGVPESWQIEVKEDNVLSISGADNLGLIYACLHFSRKYLGVDPFWFWAEKEPVFKEEIEVTQTLEVSSEKAVLNRGWFINDESCLLNWTDVYPPQDDVWQPALEALLRIGGNMIIPGTNLPRDSRAWELTKEMGLKFTHHHAEPLRTEIFQQRYPDKTPSFSKNSEFYKTLWNEAVIKQKDHDVIWALGHRSMNDAPFWEDDPSCNTPEKRGAMICNVIKAQMEIVQKHVKEPVFCTYIYQELTDLYLGGHLDLPDSVIKVWSDDGYGIMRNRRHAVWEAEQKSTIVPKDKQGSDGIYYHVAFEDGMHSNNLAPLAGPDIIIPELQKCLDNKMDKYWLINCGNIRPQIQMLDLIGKIWNGENTDKHIEDTISRWYDEKQSEITEVYESFYSSVGTVYETEDFQLLGEQFYHKPMRDLMQFVIKSEEKLELVWLESERYQSLVDLAKTFRKRIERTMSAWEKLKAKSETLTENKFYHANLLLPIILHESGCKAVLALTKAIEEFKANKDEELAYLYANDALDFYKQSLAAMQKAEHGKWKNFYRGDWTICVKLTIANLKDLIGYIRLHGAHNFTKRWSNFCGPQPAGDCKIKDKLFTDEEILVAIKKARTKDGSYSDIVK